jgi:hypothetical protein
VQGLLIDEHINNYAILEMTREEVIAFKHKRYGNKWIRPFAQESGYAYTSV